MTREDTIAIAQSWQAAANAQDVDSLETLSAPHIEIIGPRGSGFGHQLLRDWLGRAGLTLTTLRVFARDDVVVLAQPGVWRSLETGEIVGERDLASRFRVAGGQVVQYSRYDRLDETLAAAGLEFADETSS